MNTFMWVMLSWLLAMTVVVAFLIGARRGREKEEEEISKQLLIEEAESLLARHRKEKPHRPDWDEYFLLIAQAVSTRGECTRSQVGAVIVRDRRIVATGYNGVAAGQESCLDGICPRANNDVPKGSLYQGTGECVATHAEENAINDAIARKLPVFGSTVYLTKEPCEKCARLLGTLEMTAVWPQKPRSVA